MDVKKTFFIEGYGCSLNIGETEQISGFLTDNKFKRVFDFKKANFIIINTCSVKMVTEQRMLSRIKLLFENKKINAKIIVVGCLAKTNKKEIENISKSFDLVVLDTKLSSISKYFDLNQIDFSPNVTSDKTNKLVSIIPISIGCLGNCTYCATKIARGNLKSYSLESLNTAFKKAIKTSKEIWLTSQDLGCYGFDINTDLPTLLEKLLENKGDYKIRLGMMNPNHFNKIQKDLLPLFDDERLYKFLHLPVQSGSNKILKSMNRFYTKEDYIKIINKLKKIIPSITISTDIIVGFPFESEIDFLETVDVTKKTMPQVINLSRFGKRKGTIAATLPNQINETIKKDRSKKISELSKDYMLKNNQIYLNKIFKILIVEKEKDFFTGRTNNYRPVLVKSNKSLLGKIVKVKITSVYSHFLKGELIN
ncbi:MAG: tRNA (N(6)-L-threonylcarbamoyladenosine(37)-C(2))-methylthiotransferase [Candidatus ainarchaeum sp.]|nr:tRNA (N(6)-L-threonylcarbamoyladenosine(37)-C(2))-methylthiotransferase [Candidatus ainarchaeum sp.]